MATIDITFPKEEGIPGYYDALDRINDAVTEAVERGDKIIVLSDRGIDADRVPVSSLLATGMVHHHLVRNKWRAQAALVVETAEAREVHHMCVLVGSIDMLPLPRSLQAELPRGKYASHVKYLRRDLLE